MNTTILLIDRQRVRIELYTAFVCLVMEYLYIKRILLNKRTNKRKENLRKPTILTGLFSVCKTHKHNIYYI